MKTICKLIAISCLSNSLFAQQDPLYSQYLTNPLMFNPAYAGLNNALNVSVGYRNQWAGFEGGPSTASLNSHLSMINNKVGVGGIVLRDVLGSTGTTEAHLTTSYKLDLGKQRKYIVSFGLQFGYVNSKNNYSQLRLDDPTDAAFSQDMNFAWPNFGAGAIFRSDQFLFGFSVPRLLESRSDIGGDFLLYNQHFYMFSSYIHYLGARLRLKPSLLLRGVKGALPSVDLNFNINIDTRYTGGVFVRSFQSYGLLLQAWFMDKLRFGYTFELPANNSVGPQFTSHELTLGIKTAILNLHDRSYSEF